MFASISLFVVILGTLLLLSSIVMLIILHSEAPNIQEEYLDKLDLFATISRKIDATNTKIPDELYSVIQGYVFDVSRLNSKFNYDIATTKEKDEKVEFDDMIKQILAEDVKLKLYMKDREPIDVTSDIDEDILRSLFREFKRYPFPDQLRLAKLGGDLPEKFNIAHILLISSIIALVLGLIGLVSCSA